MSGTRVVNGLSRCLRTVIRLSVGQVVAGDGRPYGHGKLNWSRMPERDPHSLARPLTVVHTVPFIVSSLPAQHPRRLPLLPPLSLVYLAFAHDVTPQETSCPPRKAPKDPRSLKSRTVPSLPRQLLQSVGFTSPTRSPRLLYSSGGIPLRERQAVYGAVHLYIIPSLRHTGRPPSLGPTAICATIPAFCQPASETKFRQT